MNLIEKRGKQDLMMMSKSFERSLKRPLSIHNEIYISNVTHLIFERQIVLIKYKKKTESKNGKIPKRFHFAPPKCVHTLITITRI